MGRHDSPIALFKNVIGILLKIWETKNGASVSRIERYMVANGGRTGEITMIPKLFFSFFKLKYSWFTVLC